MMTLLAPAYSNIMLMSSSFLVQVFLNLGNLSIAKLEEDLLSKYKSGKITSFEAPQKIMCVSQLFIVRVKAVVKSSGSLSIINLGPEIKRGS